MKKKIRSLLAVMLALWMPWSVSAETGEIPVTLTAASAILIEPVSGKVLLEQNADEALPPASVTKIMSLLLVMEAIDSGKLREEDMISCSETAAAMGGSQIWLKPGEEMSVRDLLKATAVVSANDATVLLAETVAGSEEGFVAQMNERAQQLGMEHTHFANATGLDAENHYSCARDIAVMAAELLRHDKIREYTTIWMDTLREGKSELVNTNKLVRFYPGCTGLKTGTTAKAGYCLCASAQREGLSLIAVVMDAPSSKERFADAQKLLNYGYANYRVTRVENPPESTGMVAVEKGVVSQVSFAPFAVFSALLGRQKASEIVSEIHLEEPLQAPIREGDRVGQVEFLLDGEPIGSVDLVAGESVERLTFSAAVRMIFSMLFSG